MAGDDDRPGILAEGGADLLGEEFVAELHCDLAIGARLAGWDGAGDGIDLCVEFRDAREIEVRVQ